MNQNLLSNIVLGVAIGDAIGVPVEFEPRLKLKQNPVTGMREYGTHDQPKGTWSDDTSLTLCLAESIVEGFDLQQLANKFVAWKNNNHWTPHGWVFDIGIGTRIAIDRLEKGEQPEYAGGFEEMDNGNGSLMRILPLVLLTVNLSAEESYSLTKKVSSLTHGHVRSVISCFYYLEFAKKIIEGITPYEAFVLLQSEVTEFLIEKKINPDEISKFNRLLQGNIALLNEEDIKSSGYVLDTLEASVWCLLTTGSYEKAVLKAVNLGHDTDTTGAVVGGLAALYYGIEAIPNNWLLSLARLEDINNLCNQYEKVM
ncbi:ADP-ribosylation/crystallin J1 [Flavobacterium cauense R2A-7]|uniref:ADP-ribosylglycohydrolase n=1 Tax=Flavobacterium cauense R2A-7 TaxID=1341154 RepID=V6S488_9FLAO|nr:ADP-ribosylglycohydrolase family protein [Flavobacterium cauense]ESU19165.1 ADP-ribosylation/crystallin J1 [Flavobacterium cauense R2A-7]KGO82207.1 crystallin [Flavobacterium cauense R2A-7]TWI15163.1 ADP-ribosylglycohydrolase [Flavobacterium cauense R2A-7]